MVLNKKWTFIFNERADRQFSKLDKTIQKKILNYLEALVIIPNPLTKGKALRENLKTFWRYRVGDYRILCHFEQSTLVIVVVKIAHRSDVYKNIT